MQLNGIISGFSNNSDLRIRRIVPDIPADSIVTSALLTVKTNETDVDADAVILKAITTTDNEGVGQIEDDGADESAVLRFDITPEDSAILTPSTEYHYWVDVTLDTGEIIALEKGTIFCEQGSSN